MAPMTTRSLLGVLLLFSSIAHADEPAPPEQQNVITISKETTFFTEPLDDEGFVDYIAALNNLRREGVTPETNFVVGLLEAVDPDVVCGVDALPPDTSEEERQAYRDRFYEALGVEEPTREGPYLELFSDFIENQVEQINNPRKQERRREALEACRNSPWAAEKMPEVAAWLERNDGMLDRVVEASKRTGSFWPYDESGDKASARVIMILMPFAARSRDVAGSLTVRAYYRIATGKRDGAWDDIQAMRRIARHMGRRGFLIDSLIGLAIETIALKCTEAWIESGSLAASAARARIGMCKRLPMIAVGDPIDQYERIWALDAVCALARRTASGEAPLGVLKEVSGSEPPLAAKLLWTVLSRDGVDWDLVLRGVNGEYDRLVEVFAIEDPIERAKRMEEWYSRFHEKYETPMPEPSSLDALVLLANPRKRVSEFVQKIVVALFLPAVDAAKAAEVYTVPRKLDHGIRWNARMRFT